MILSSMMMNDGMIDFKTDGPGEDWRVVVDGVMGGLSTATLELTDESLILDGTVSLENNGGFASVRSPYGDFALGAYTSVTVRYRATGQSFYLSTDIHKQWWLPSYRLHFPQSEEWSEVSHDLADMVETRVGESTGKTITVDQLDQIIQMGFITGDKRSGPFRIEIDFIKFH